MEQLTDILPAFILILDEENCPVYINKFAQKYITEKIPEEIINGVSLIYLNSKNGKERGSWFMMREEKIKWKDKPCSLYFGADFSDIISNEERLSATACVDPVTKIFNRQAGFDLLERLIERQRASKDDVPFALCVFVAENFKEMKDEKERETYLKAIINVVRQTARISDVFARLLEDEFMLIFPRCSKTVAEASLKEASRALSFMKNDYSIKFGIIEIGYNNIKSVSELLEDALKIKK